MHSPAQRVLLSSLLAAGLACSEGEPVSWSPAGQAPAEQAGSGLPRAGPAASSPAAGKPEQPAAPRVYYSFIDGSGSVRMVDSLDAVPSALRPKAKRIEVKREQASASGAERPTRSAMVQPSPFARAAAGSEVPDTRSVGGDVVIYTAKWCGWCRKALADLDERRVSYRNRDIDDDPGAKTDLIRLTGATAVPAFEINGEIVRGYDAERVASLLDARR